ncbi:phage FluMu protein Com [Clostridium acetobutylicum]|uniref:Phage regulatory Com-like protein, containing Zn-finger n=1 Tax=Clostridium acetobutylicum (strain ATCC 824 / DSM 792 / JCM 1419 / IAM 19013 / LMG 5710 / NBRC 13948 / NRRL B-527 / VKM B-1787 / 2291 / W) TaxID=272562 RepID=Q97HV7_CLOAB|nr:MULTISPECIES: Com family DNA-binding transcriptional regulator [Clostridium]AAK79863.1 Phage regulatory Com-like protein, containing Zn-finger [Clostridium acetobutylicum ATCC 824]ADZ20949.1 Phage regulatory Com-like protein, containing Zn-finger [Clostridium acetobutylicum EA 2018]AEI32038.1 Phage regulatory CoM-like protein, containing Zn-finger [Clostridium acetobutylicum DSM 1731]AWV79708.1 Com family DNA-binding transcriptional regulator [Clostridium acetobutylicum]MBC2394315.1 Com fam
MQTLRCAKCGKVLLEAEGQAHIKKKCPKCKEVNEFYIKEEATTQIHKSNKFKERGFINE